MTTVLDKIHHHLAEAERLAADELKVTNIFYNEAFIEAFMANKLNHNWNKETQGGDAYEQDGTPTEYKAINTNSKCNGSFQFHWLSDNKMSKLRETRNMYLARRAGVTLSEIYKLKTPHLLDKIERKCTNSKSTDGHVSFSFKQMLDMDPERVY
jgi:hypothetical protein